MKLRELPNTVVRVYTQDKYDRLMQIYKDAGWRWVGGDDPVTWRPAIGELFKDDKEDIRVCNRFHRTSARPGERILSFSDFLREQGIEEPQEFKVGDWVEVVEGFVSAGEKFTAGERFRITWVGDDQLLLDTSACGFGHGGNGFEGCPPLTGKNWWCRKKCFRKCSPPCENVVVDDEGGMFIRVTHKASGGSGGVNAGCDGDPRDLTMTASPNMDDNFFVKQWETEWIKDKPSKPISSPSFFMSALNFIREKALSKEERTLRKAELKDYCGNWTEYAKEAAMELLLKDKSDELVQLAEEMLKKRKEEKKDCGSC